MFSGYGNYQCNGACPGQTSIYESSGGSSLRYSYSYGASNSMSVVGGQPGGNPTPPPSQSESGTQPPPRKSIGSGNVLCNPVLGGVGSVAAYIFSSAMGDAIFGAELGALGMPEDAVFGGPVAGAIIGMTIGGGIGVVSVFGRAAACGQMK